MGVGNRLKEIRKEMGMTQRGFGEGIGVSNNYVSEIEAEKKVPATPVILAIEYVYGINSKWLLQGKGEKYISEKMLFTDKEAEIIKSFREMSEETKKVFLTLIEKLQRK